MLPGKYPLAIYRGDSGRWRFVLWLDGARQQPANLAGVMAKAEIRDRPGGAYVYPMWTLVTLPNIVDMGLDPVWSAQLPKRGVWDIQLHFPDGQLTTIVRGEVAVMADVTDSDVTDWATQAEPDQVTLPRPEFKAPPRLVELPRRRLTG